ncbi:MAG: DUF6572 domain-containing protein [Bryobacterales bacterium]
MILTISDHLDWSDSLEHQTLLQTKLNSYLAFIESGEILEHYPDARDRAVALRVVFKYDPDASGNEFLRRARSIVESAGFALRWGRLASEASSRE